MTAAGKALSVVVACHEMARELPRTLRSLAVPYQRGIAREEYEVVLVDNGSAVPPRQGDFADLDLDLRVLRHPGPTPSPVPALNAAVAATTAPLVGVMIDGGRMLTPGVLAAALAASRMWPRTVVATLNFHLGPDLQWLSVAAGYDRAAEDRLLASIGWPADGYRLFDIGARADNTDSGWYGRLSESNALFLPRALWEELGGYDEGFRLPGGGAANVDIFHRATALPGVRLVVLLGEGSFHQVHGGISTNAGREAPMRLKEQAREYMRLRGRPIQRHKAERAYLGPVSNAARDAFARAPLTHAVPSGIRPGGERAATLYTELLKTVLLDEHRRPAGAERAGLRGRMDRYLGRETDPVSRRVTSGFTMIGRRRLDHLADCVATVLRDGVPGDLIECGVWRGGAAMLMRGMLMQHGVTDRRVWLADSFAGLPPPRPGCDDEVDISAARYPELAVSLAEVKANFAALGLLDAQVRFLEGWFADTLPQAPTGPLAVLRIDGDLYSSTTDALDALYPRVSPGGFVIVDDYGALDQCARAVDEFRVRHGIREPIEAIDGTGVFWRRG